MRIQYLTPPGWDGRSCLHWCDVSFAEAVTWTEVGAFVLWVVVGAVVDVHKARRARKLRVISDVMES